MSTNGLTSWAVDLNNIGALYPFQGSETLMVILGFIFWIGWHVWQIRNENAEIAQEKSRAAAADRVKKAIDRY